MPSLRNIRGSRKTTTTIKPRSAPTGTSRRRTASVRPRSAPGRISLNKESILKMTRTEARSALRATTPMTFYKMGKRGLVMFALLLIMATQPTQAFLNHAAAYREPAPAAPAPAKRWWQSFGDGKETSGAMQVARAGTAMTVAVSTGSGAATGAVIASQLSSSPWGRFILTLACIGLFVKQILDYGKAYMNRQTAKNQMAFMARQLAAQERMLTMMVEAQQRPRRRVGARTPALPAANRLALPAIAAA